MMGYSYSFELVKVFKKPVKRFKLFFVEYTALLRDRACHSQFLGVPGGQRGAAAHFMRFWLDKRANFLYDRTVEKRSHKRGVIRQWKP